MQPIFEPKAKLPYDLDVLEKMKATALERLSNTKNGQCTQAIVLYSASGKEYSTIIRDACSLGNSGEESLLEALRASSDTKIRYVLCMWQDGGIDIPSFAFRRMLIALDPENSESLLFVMTAKGVSVVKTAVTMK